MAGLEGIDASKMELVDALGIVKWNYDPGDRIVRPLVRHADFIPVAIQTDEGRIGEKVRFGLPVAGGRLITNARDDKVATSNAWKGLLASGRGIAGVSYVVERDAKTGEAFRIQRRDCRLMVVPALVARRHYKFTSTGNEYDDLGHVQVTADSNAFVGQVHDRFVVELPTKMERESWMDANATQTELLELLRPAPDDRYEMLPIAPDVWTRRNDPDAAKPIGPARKSGSGQRRLAL